jgi:RNA polymerase sigma factor (TIGR02999 family)
MGELVEVVYPELRKLAHSCLRGERNERTLRTTALINEAYIRLVEQQPQGIHNRAYFFGVASRLMRQILVDYARQRDSAKRGADVEHVNLDEGAVVSPDRWEEILLVDDALKRLGMIDARQAQLVEMRFYADLSIEEAAEALRISPATAKREWRPARAWLYRAVRQPGFQQ